MVKAAVIGLVTVLFVPVMLLLGMGALLNPAAQASCQPSSSTVPASDASVPETARVVFPLPAGTWVKTSPFGMRVHPVTGVYKLHTGVDLAAPRRTHILAAADGRVAFAGPASGYGHLILIKHMVNGHRIVTGYAHMFADGIHVQLGDAVTAGQHIADVGMDGYATGPHLHFEVRPGGADAGAVDPEPWLASNRAVDAENTTTGKDDDCGDSRGPATSYAGSQPNHLVDDPTTRGKITERTANALAQIEKNFPNSHWSCWTPPNGQKSEHALGRACDGTFGNSIGTAASGPALDVGWKVTNWLKTNASKLGVEYLIWQGRIWSVARASEGWRKYNGGGMFDPTSVTGGHFDHLHVTVAGI